MSSAHKLYGARQTGSFAPQALFEEIDVPHAVVELDLARGEHRTAAFLAINPLAQVPVLVTPEGDVITESAAIMLHILERFPDSGLIPEPGSAARDQFYRWLLFMAVNVYTADCRVVYAERYTTDPSGADAVKARGVQDMDACFAALDSAIGGSSYTVGDAYSAADIYLFMLIGWHPDPPAVLARHRGLARVRENVLARPVIARLAAAHGFV